MLDARTRFTSLVRAHSADLLRYAYWLCGNRTAAEDLVQETFMRAWHAFGQIRDENAAKSWLFTTLRREHARGYSRPKIHAVPLADVEIEDTNRNLDDSTEAHVLRVALAGLAQEYREPLVLQVVGGFKGEEIATMLGLSVGAVNVRLCRARQQLRAILSGAEHSSNQVARS